MLDINDTKMKYEDNPENKNHATCTCEPLDRGYGTTIGSSLKRILLSSIQGAAVVAVRFNGADSMEDQLEGVKDSICIVHIAPFCQKQWAAALVWLSYHTGGSPCFDCALILKTKID